MIRTIEQTSATCPPTKGVSLFDDPVLCSIHQPANAVRPERTIAIRLASQESERNSASMVINRSYGARGYGSHHHIKLEHQTVTFTASSGTTVFGTITLKVDSDCLLSTDKTFTEELSALRSEPGTKLCELSKFAFDPSPDARPYLASLFHIIYLYGTDRFQCTDLVIEVNPRHVKFYQMMLGFECIGELKSNKAVSAPSQLMRIKVEKIGESIDRLAGEFVGMGRSLYPYFFNKAEEAGLRRRIGLLTSDTTPQSVGKFYTGDKSKVPIKRAA